MYQFYREGVSNYRFDVKDGTYEIEIYLAELTHKEVGQRVMDVSINNNLVWDNLDLVKEYGAQRAISRKFTVSAKNSKGIEIGFIAKSGITILNGLRVIRLSN